MLRQLGELTDSDYEDEGTFTDSGNELTAMSELGYIVSPDLNNYSDDVSFQSALADDKLIYMSGLPSSNARSMAKSGHSWVVDGYFERELHYTVYTREINSPLMELVYENYIYNRYNHINWGEYGSCNGYFLEDVFNTSNAAQYDNSMNSLNSNYTVSLKYFFVTK